MPEGTADGASIAGNGSGMPLPPAFEQTSVGLRISTAIVVVSGYLALSTTAEHGREILTLPAAMLLLAPLGERADARFKIYGHLTSALAAVFAVATIVSIPRVGLLSAITWLVIFIQGHKLCHRKRRRDYYQTFLMAFFLLVAGCAQSPEPVIGLVMALFLVGSVWAFVAAQIRDESEASQNGAQPDIVPLDAAQALGPLAVTPGVQSTERGGRGLAASIAGLSAGCLAMTFGLFLLTPRMEAGLFNVGDAHPSTAGVSDEVDIAEGGLISLDDSPMMRVEFPDEADGTYDGTLYWRVTSLDSYMWGEWGSFDIPLLQREGSGDLQFRREAVNRVERTPHTGRVRTVRQVIYLDAHTFDGLPCLPYVRSLESTGARIGWDPRQDYTVNSLSNRRSIEYQVVSEVPEASPAALRAAPESYEGVLRSTELFVLTNHNLEPQTVALAHQIAANADTTYDKVMMIRDWFLKGDYVYSIRVPSLPRHRAVDAFVREVRTGHCQLFASSMTLMLRSLGIPCRIAKGFRGGEWSPSDSAYFVTNSMAHLWVEVYFSEIGWVPFDPSPPTTRVPSVWGMSRFMATVSRSAVNARGMWYRHIVGYRGRMLSWEGIRGMGLRLARLNIQASTSGQVPGSDAGQGQSWFRKSALLALLVGTVAYLIRHRRNVRAGPAHSLSADQRRAVRVYGLLKRELRRQGLDCRGKTAEEILGEARDRALVDPEPASRIVDAYNATRFGGFPMEHSRYLRLAAVVRSLYRTNRARSRA